MPKSVNQCQKTLPLILEDAENDLTSLSREVFSEQYTKLVVLDEEIKDQDNESVQLCKITIWLNVFLSSRRWADDSIHCCF